MPLGAQLRVHAKEGTATYMAVNEHLQTGFDLKPALTDKEGKLKISSFPTSAPALNLMCSLTATSSLSDDDDVYPDVGE